MFGSQAHATRRWCAWLLVVVPACFDPTYHDPQCSPRDECPSGYRCGSQHICELEGAPLCLQSAVSSECGFRPFGDVTVATNLSLDTDAGTSTPPGVQCFASTTELFGPCVVTADRITIAAGATLSAHGTRGLALIGHALDVEGIIDVASHTTGPLAGQRGAGAGDCPLSTPILGGAIGGGGGAGGSYNKVSVGGGGGGQGDSSTGGVPGTGGGPPTGIGGGCGGEPGGTGTGTDASPRFGGAAGGAIWLGIDTGTLVIGPTAVINASGAGGGPGLTDNRGGDGGGSGGLIFLQAPRIQLDASARLFANGGGGGGGAIATRPGTAGGDPSSPSTGGPGGRGATTTISAGVGGNGYPAVDSSGRRGELSTTAAGGGGGGGAGWLLVASTTVIAATSNMSPAPVAIPPQ